MAHRAGRFSRRADALLERGLSTYRHSDPALLRASHIVPWSQCDDDAQRLDVHNGLLLSALWDAGVVSFENEGAVLIHPRLSETARRALAGAAPPTLPRLTERHAPNLVRHRASAGVNWKRA